MRILRQPTNSPLSQHEQVITLVFAIDHGMQNVGLEKIPSVNREILAYFEDMYPELCSRIDREGVISDEDIETIKTEARAFVESRE